MHREAQRRGKKTEKVKIKIEDINGEWLTVRESIALLGISRTGLNRLLTSESIKSIKENGNRLISRESLMEYKKKQTGYNGIDVDLIKEGWKNVSESKEMLGISRTQLYRLISSGKIESIKKRGRRLRGGNRLINRESLMEYKKEQTKHNDNDIDIIEEDWENISESKEILCISRTQLYRLISSGKIKSIKRHNRRLINKESLIQFKIENNL